MPRKRILTWHGPSKRWKKYYRGHLYYLTKGRGKSDLESYRASVQMWIEKKALIDANSSDVSNATFETDLARPPKETRSRRVPRTVHSAIEAFIDLKRGDAIGGGITLGRVQTLVGRLKQFGLKFGSKPFAQITESALDQYYTEQTNRIADGEVKPSTVAQDMNAVRQFLKWCYRRRLLKSLPRNLDDLRVRRRGNASILSEHRHLFLAPKQIRLLLDHLNGRDDSDTLFTLISKEVVVASCLLGLNCGMTQQDISDLKVASVKLSKRPPRIQMRRSKTKQEGNYLMWRKTRSSLARLCKGKDPDDAVLTRRDGTPLVRHLPSGGRSDVLGRVFTRLVQDSLGDSAPFRFRELRRTGANMCRQRMPGIETLYLAHRDRRMAASYTTPPQAVFDDMMRYLEKDIGLEDTLDVKVRKVHQA